MSIRKGFTPLEVRTKGRPFGKSGLLLTGFTLIELLVVIAIIALLMAILMPALNRVKKQAKAVACQAKLKQWGLFLDMYAEDNNGYFMSGSGGKYFEWMEPALPYYKQGAMRLCPMATKNLHPGAGHWGSTFTTWQRDDFVGSYGINEFLFNPNPGMITQWGHPTSMNWRTKNVQRGQYIPAFADCLWVGAAPHHTDEPPDFEGEWHHSFNHNMKRLCLNRHGGAINIVFLDWSLQRVRLKSLWRHKWNREYDTNYPLPVWPEWMRSLPDPD
ncbi:MAG: type II secretion system protein [Sedimentisphaerales bacterium]